MPKSSFDQDEQINHLDNKIVVGLERIYEAFRVLLWQQSKDSKLSPIQIQLLIFLNFHNQTQGTVSYMAKEFSLTKATVSDSLKTMITKGLLTKHISAYDSRSYTLQLTVTGKTMVNKLLDFAEPVKKTLSTLNNTEQLQMWSSLQKVIINLQQTHIISLQRMCFNCVNYESKNGKHYCNLLQIPLAEKDIRIDCPEHQLKLGS